MEAEDDLIRIEYFECTTQQQENVRNDICDGVRGALAGLQSRQPPTRLAFRSYFIL